MKPDNIIFGITTCPREVPTFTQSLTSLYDAAPIDTAIISYPNDGTIGALAAYNQTMNELLISAHQLMRKYICVVPDDIVYMPNFLYSMPDEFEGYHALYTPKGLAERYNFKIGINEIKGGWASSWGGAYVMSVETAERLINNPFWKHHCAGTIRSPQRYLNYAKGKRIDHAIPEVMHRLKLPQMFHAPSLVKHIGLTSTIGHEHTEHENAYLWD